MALGQCHLELLDQRLIIKPYLMILISLQVLYYEGPINNKVFFGQQGYYSEYYKNSLTTSISDESGIKFIVSQINKGRIPAIGFYLTGAPSGAGHISLFKRIRYLADYSKFKITLMNPGNSNNVIKNFKKSFVLFGLWK